MKINIITVGKIKESYLTEAINEYKKRLSRFCHLEIIEVLDDDSEKELSIEGKRIKDKLPFNAYNIVLAIKGNELSSEEFASKISNIMSYNNSSINFIIGGSNGLDQEILNLADYQLSFSKMTYPHQLMRVILLEQIYRAFKILNNETYHK